MEATKTSTRSKYHRSKLSQTERAVMQAAALERAQDGKMCANDLFIIAAYGARGIDAHPRVDVFTYNAWRALHRHVRKGEHGVRITTYTHTETRNPDGTTDEQMFPVSAVVFHVSQTDPDPAEGA
jgi:hypothetical protein